MNKMRLNHKPEDKQVKRIHHLVLFLFVTLIAISLIIFCNSFYLMDQSNNDPSNIEIQTIANVKRLLIDTQINTWTADHQWYPKVTSLSNGNFVVVWQSFLENGSGFNSIYGQIFYSNGNKMGNEFPISNYITIDQTNPNVAASSNGRFMVVWMQSDGNIFGQMFMNDGTKLGNPFQININI